MSSIPSATMPVGSKEGTRNNSLISQSESLISATRRPYNDEEDHYLGGSSHQQQQPNNHHHRHNSKSYGTKRSAQDSAAFWAERAKVAAVVKKNHHDLISGTGPKQQTRDLTPVEVGQRRKILGDSSQVTPCRLPLAVQNHLIQEYLGYSNDKVNGGALTLKTLPLFLVSIGLQVSTQFNIEAYFAARGNQQGDARIVQPDELLGVVEAMEFGETQPIPQYSNINKHRTSTARKVHRTSSVTSQQQQRNNGGGGTVVDQLEDELSPTRRRSNNHDHHAPQQQHYYDDEYDSNDDNRYGGVDARAVTQRLMAAYGADNSTNAAQATQTLLRELQDAREPQQQNCANSSTNSRGNSPLRSFLGDEASSSDFHTMSLRAFRIITGENELEEECLEATADQIVSACEVYYGDHRITHHHHQQQQLSEGGSQPNGKSLSSKQKYPHATAVSLLHHQLPPQQLAGRTAFLHELSRNNKHRSDTTSPNSPQDSRSASPSSRNPGSPTGLGSSTITNGFGFAVTAVAMGSSTQRAAARLKLTGRGGAASDQTTPGPHNNHPASWDVYKSSVASAIIDRLSQTGGGSSSTHSRVPTAPPSRHASSKKLSIIPTTADENVNRSTGGGGGATTNTGTPSTSCSMDLLNFQHQLRTDIADLNSYLEERGISPHNNHQQQHRGDSDSSLALKVRLPVDHRLVVAELVAHVFPFCIQRLCGKDVLIALRNTRALDCQEPLYTLVLKRDGPKKLLQQQNSKKKGDSSGNRHSITEDHQSSNNHRAIMGAIAQAQNIQNKLLADLSPTKEDGCGGRGRSVWARDAQGNISGRICASPQHQQRGGAGGSTHDDDDDDHGASKDPAFEDRTMNSGGDRFGGTTTPTTATGGDIPHYLTPRARDAQDDIHKAQLERAAFRKQNLNEMRERRRFEQRPYLSPRSSTTTTPQRRVTETSDGIGSPTPPTTPSGATSRRPNTAASSSSTPTLMALMASARKSSPSRLTAQTMVIPTPPRDLVDGTSSSSRLSRKSLTSDPRTMAAENLSCRPGTSGRRVEDVSPAEAEVEKEAARFDRPYNLHMPRIGQYRHFHGAQYPAPLVSHTPPRSASQRKRKPSENQPSPTSVFKFQHLAERPKSTSGKGSSPRKKCATKKKIKKNTGASIEL